VSDVSDVFGAPRDDPDKATDGERLLVIGGDGGFRLNAITLSDAMIEQIDQLFKGPDATDILCGRFIIEGHTDNLGSKDVNDRIGLARALAVRQYLSEQFEIPREAVKLVSYGADRPAGDNTTQEGRTKNRRVVIRMTHDVH
jgi:outer membrane protein OmpA-like peptidoglycan-associated protein